MRENDKLVKIAEFDGSFEAELAKLTLENAGIESVVFGETLAANVTHINTVQVELQVFEQDVERAKAILAEKQPLDGDEGDQ